MGHQASTDRLQAVESMRAVNCQHTVIYDNILPVVGRIAGGDQRAVREYDPRDRASAQRERTKDQGEGDEV
jgi:5-methylcytosine-specific restriction endonuclease McrA